MKNFKHSAAQGDLLIERVDSLPSDLKAANPKEDGNHILAHSETGHNHVVAASHVNYYPANDEFFGFLEVKEKAEVIHLRGFDTHDPISLDKGLYKITRQREYIPEGYRRAQD